MKYTYQKLGGGYYMFFGRMGCEAIVLHIDTIRDFKKNKHTNNETTATTN